jgi:hypothetical protein
VKARRKMHSNAKPNPGKNMVERDVTSRIAELKKGTEKNSHRNVCAS